MSRSEEKKQILDNAKYVYHFNRDIYYNRIDKKILSLEAIEDNDPNWLNEKINEIINKDEWYFYFNNPPSDKIKNEILKELDK